MPDFTEIPRVICCSLNHQNHLPALTHNTYLYYLKAIKMSPTIIYCSLICWTCR